jgi:fermentation-respiration switch protein FrsA (DUF1100 family)
MTARFLTVKIMLAQIKRLARRADVEASAGNVNFRNDTRAPLLLVAGGKDRVVPTSLVKANFESYRESKAEIDYKEFPDESNFTLFQDTEIADHALGWALRRVNGSKLTAVPNHTDSWSVQL